MADFARYTVLNWNYIQVKNFQIFHDRFFFCKLLPQLFCTNEDQNLFGSNKIKLFLGTCKCHKNLYGHWYNFPPYVVQQGAYRITGMFTTVIQSMIIEACGTCDQYANSTLHFDVSRTGLDPNRRSVYELKVSITDDVDVSFPYYERRSTQTVVPGSIFVPLISSPGCAFIVRDELNIEKITHTLVLKVLKLWPLLLISYCIASLFGILIWSTVSSLTAAAFTCIKLAIGTLEQVVKYFQRCKHISYLVIV